MSIKTALRAALAALAAHTLMGWTNVDPAQAVTTVPSDAGVASYSPTRVRDLAITSSALGKTAYAQVILPADPASAPNGGWPVVYFLPGSDANRFIWQAEPFNFLYSWSARDGVAVVVPDVGTAGYYSDWKSGPRWQTFHLRELPAAVESAFPIDRTRQALAGYSMGGFGALSYAAQRPRRFRAVVALSPVANPLHNPSVVLDDLRDAYGSSARYKLWGNPRTTAGKKTWKAHDPYYRAKGLHDTYLYLYAGRGDSYERMLRTQTVRLVNQLKKLGLRKLHISLHTSLSGKGHHEFGAWSSQLKHAWPGMVTALKKK